MVFKQNAADAWTNDEKHAGTSETAISQLFFQILTFFLKKIQVWKFIDTERPKNELKFYITSKTPSLRLHHKL